MYISSLASSAEPQTTTCPKCGFLYKPTDSVDTSEDQSVDFETSPEMARQASHDVQGESDHDQV